MDVDPAELHFLLLHFLFAGPCQNAAQVLEQEAVDKGLLPLRTDIFGAFKCIRVCLPAPPRHSLPDWVLTSTSSWVLPVAALTG